MKYPMDKCECRICMEFEARRDHIYWILSNCSEN